MKENITLGKWLLIFLTNRIIVVVLTSLLNLRRGQLAMIAC